MDLTPYIFDAPFRSLPLITRNKHTHDWGNLLNHFQAQHSAETLADMAFYGGTLVALAGTGLSVYLLVRIFFPKKKAQMGTPVVERNRIRQVKR